MKLNGATKILICFIEFALIVLFVCLAIKYKFYYFSIPIIIFAIIFTVTIMFFTSINKIEVKSFKLDDNKLIITRENQTLLTIKKENLENIVVVFDMFYENIDAVKFIYKGKKVKIDVPRNLSDDMKIFICGLDYKRKRYLLSKIIGFIVRLFLESK